MKCKSKILALILVFLMVMLLASTALAETTSEISLMTDTIIEVVAAVVQVALVGLIGVLFGWIQSRTKSDRLSAALEQMKDAAIMTAAELKQTTVESLKKANEEGKLTDYDIAILGRDSLKLVKARMSESAQATVRAAGLDLEDLIRAQVEAAVVGMKAV